jgi:hypothetical protein
MVLDRALHGCQINLIAPGATHEDRADVELLYSRAMVDSILWNLSVESRAELELLHSRDMSGARRSSPSEPAAATRRPPSHSPSTVALSDASSIEPPFRIVLAARMSIPWMRSSRDLGGKTRGG